MAMKILHNPLHTGTTTAAAADAPVPDPAADPLWEFQDDDGSWKAYDDAAQAVIEGAWAGGTVVVNVTCGAWTYTVDLNQMVQTNIQHPARTVRLIRRNLMLL